MSEAGEQQQPDAHMDVDDSFTSDEGPLGLPEDETADQQPHALDPLLDAAAAGDVPAVLQLLSELKAAACGADGLGYTALHAAAEHGHGYCVALLLQAGAQVDAATEDEQDTALHLATLHGHAEIVLQLLEAGADPDAADSDGCTALHIAAEAGSCQLVQLLLVTAADLDAQDSDQQTPLMLAVQEGHTSVVQQLLAEDANVSTACESDDMTALHLAALQGHSAIVGLLLHKQQHQQSFVGPDSGHGTPLQLAAQFNQPDAVLQLLAAGQAASRAALKTGDDLAAAVGVAVERAAAYHTAAQFGSSPCGALLLAAGALASKSEQHAAMTHALEAGDCSAMRQLVSAGVHVDFRLSAGNTPLHSAARSGDTAMVQELLGLGASLTAANDFSRTALMCAAVNNQLGVARLLLQAAQACGVVRAVLYAQDSSGDTVLHNACYNYSSKLVRLLLQAGACVDAEGQDGKRPLHAAAEVCAGGIVHQLLAAGADVEAVDQISGNTPLHAAIDCQSYGAVKQLLNAGAQQPPNQQGAWTPLHLAASAGLEDITGLLLEAGAAVNTTDDDSKTALHLAAEEGHEGVVQLLLDAGASVGLLDCYGASALHYAAHTADATTVRLLLQTGAADVHQPAAADGDTPLHRAARGGDVGTVQLLLDAGATNGPLNDDGHTALELAVIESRLPAVQLLFTWAPLDVEGLKASITKAAREGKHVVNITVYLLQQLAAVDDAAVLEVLQSNSDIMDPTQVMYGLVKALHAASADNDAVAVTQAAKARELAEQRRGVQHLITGLAAMQLQLRQEGQQGQEQQPAWLQGIKQSQKQEEQEDVDMGVDQGACSPAEWLFGSM